MDERTNERIITICAYVILGLLFVSAGFSIGAIIDVYIAIGQIHQVTLQNAWATLLLVVSSLFLGFWIGLISEHIRMRPRK